MVVTRKKKDTTDAAGDPPARPAKANSKVSVAKAKKTVKVKRNEAADTKEKPKRSVSKDNDTTYETSKIYDVIIERCSQ